MPYLLYLISIWARVSITFFISSASLKAFDSMLCLFLDLKGMTRNGGNIADQQHEVMKWLDDQPPNSVVFLCFGSMGCFNEAQLKEIALGLQQRGQRFLWSMRKAPPKEEFAIGDYISLEEFMPDGFVESTRNIGMVCGWAPQVEVLAHEAVVGFVSHCGWNSILESWWHGISIVTWPMYAEQEINAFEMVRKLGLAVELQLSYRKDGSDHLVMADEIENAVKRVMEKGRGVRKKVKEMSERSRKAVMEGGSSHAALGSS